MLFNCNLFNDMLLWFLPLALILVVHNMCFMFWLLAMFWGYLVVIISDLCTLLSALLEVALDKSVC